MCTSPLSILDTSCSFPLHHLHVPKCIQNMRSTGGDLDTFHVDRVHILKSQTRPRIDLFHSQSIPTSRRSEKNVPHRNLGNSRRPRVNIYLYFVDSFFVISLRDTNDVVKVYFSYLHCNSDKTPLQQTQRCPAHQLCASPLSMLDTCCFFQLHDLRVPKCN